MERERELAEQQERATTSARVKAQMGILALRATITVLRIMAAQPGVMAKIMFIMAPNLHRVSRPAGTLLG